MCGIGGFVDYEHDTRGYGPVAERMKRTLAPRGPDAEGQFCDLDAMLVHRRLIVIDPDGGQQPMASSDGNTVLIYNGELYNTCLLYTSPPGRASSIRSSAAPRKSSA